MLPSSAVTLIQNELSPVDMGIGGVLSPLTIETVGCPFQLQIAVVEGGEPTDGREPTGEMSASTHTQKNERQTMGDVRTKGQLAENQRIACRVLSSQLKVGVKVSVGKAAGMIIV
jgi:hypothetical protein